MIKCKSSVSSPGLSAPPFEIFTVTREPLRLLCDETLQRIAWWLRAAGHDTLVTTNSKVDYPLLRQAINDGRLLLTRDKHLCDHRRAQGQVVLLTARTLHESARELSNKLKLDWQCRPFSRCLACNTPLLIASQPQLTNTAKKVRTLHDTGYHCPTCRQVTWEDGHAKRMRNQLRQWHHLFAHDTDTLSSSSYQPPLIRLRKKY